MATTINDIEDVPQNYDTAGKKVMIHNQSEPDLTKQTGMIPVAQLLQYLVSKLTDEDIAGLKTFVNGIKLPGLQNTDSQNYLVITVNTDGTLSTRTGFVMSVNGNAPDPDTGDITVDPGNVDTFNLVDKTTDQTVAGKKTFTGDFTLKGAVANTVIGALVSPINLFTTVAPLLHITAVRTGTTLSNTNPNTQYQALHDAGYFIHLIANYWPIDGTHNFPSGSDYSDWQSTFDAYIDGMYAYGVRGALIGLENEPNNQGYRALDSTSAALYLAMLTHAAGKVHSVGYKLCDGGSTGPSFKYGLLQWLEAQGRTADYNTVLNSEFAPSAHVGISNGNFAIANADTIQFIQDVIAGFSATGADYINFHWYCSTNGTQPAQPVTESILLCKEWLEAATGKDAITNEIGQHNTFPGYPAIILTALVGAGMKHIYWYDGSGGVDDGTNAQPLHNIDGSLDANGFGYAGYMMTLLAALAEVLKVEGGKVKLPALATSVAKMLVINPDQLVSAEDIPIGSGNTAVPSLNQILGNNTVAAGGQSNYFDYPIVADDNGLTFLQNAYQNTLIEVNPQNGISIHDAGSNGTPGVLSADFNSRQLYDNAGNVTLDWNNPMPVPTLQQVHDAGNEIVNEQQGNNRGTPFHFIKTTAIDADAIEVNYQDVLTGLEQGLVLNHNGFEFTGDAAGTQLTQYSLLLSNPETSDVAAHTAEIATNGLFPPKYTTDQRDDELIGTEGQFIYNTDIEQLQYHDGTQWKAVGKGTLQDAFNASIEAADEPQINYINDGSPFANLVLQTASEDNSLQSNLTLNNGTASITHNGTGGLNAIRVQDFGITLISDINTYSIQGINYAQPTTEPTDGQVLTSVSTDVNGKHILQWTDAAAALFSNVQEYADNADALSNNLAIGTPYRTGDFLKIVH